MKVLGKIKVWSKEFTNKKGTIVLYSTSVSKKVEDKYVNQFLKVSFSKKCDLKPLENGEYINITDGWLTVDTYKNEVALFVNSFEYVVSKKEGKEPLNQKQIDFLKKHPDISPDDLPF